MKSGAAHLFVGVRCPAQTHFFMYCVVRCPLPSATESLRFRTAALLPRPPLHILKLPRAPKAVARTYILHGFQLMNWVIADLMPSLACSSRTAHCATVTVAQNATARPGWISYGHRRMNNRTARKGGNIQSVRLVHETQPG